MTSNYAWAYPSLAAAADLTATMSPVMNAIDATVKTVETAANAVPAVAHARFPATATLAVGAGAWTTATINSTTDSSVSPPYALASNQVTVSQAGVYLLSASISCTTMAFALRISVSGVVVAQTPVGSGASLTQSVDRAIRLAAGAVVKVEIYSTGATTMSADASTGPTSLTITRLGL